MQDLPASLYVTGRLPVGSILVVVGQALAAVGYARVMPQPTIRIGTAEDVDALADGFRQMWLDNDVPASDIRPDHREVVRSFVANARDLRFFVAQDDGGDGHDPVLGVACCQRFDGLYPQVLTDTARSYGYVWGVWVDGAQRRRGLGARLTESCVGWLRSIGCTAVHLNAAPMGRGIYTAMGFEPTNGMALDLRRTSRRR